METMSRGSLLEVHFGASYSKLSSNNARIRDLDLSLTSKGSEIGAVAIELESSIRRPCFAEDAASFML